MEGFAGLVIGVVVFVAIVLIIRLFGAWMLRIDEVIKYQKDILKELKTINSKNDKFASNQVIKTKNKREVKEKKDKTSKIEEEEIKQEKSIELPKNYNSVTIKHIHGGEETVSRKQWEKIKMKFGEENYIVLDFA